MRTPLLVAIIVGLALLNLVMLAAHPVSSTYIAPWRGDSTQAVHAIWLYPTGDGDTIRVIINLRGE